MSFERYYSSCIRLAAMAAFVLTMTVSAQADDTWHNVYHSLKRFFTGKPSATPVVHHRTRRYVEHDKTEHSVEPTPAVAEGSPSPAASATPRVVILPASSPTVTTTQGAATQGAENSVRAPEAAAKADHSTEIGPVLRSLSEPTPAGNPAALPSPVAGTGTTTSD
jgi:hypothetical protein